MLKETKKDLKSEKVEHDKRNPKNSSHLRTKNNCNHKYKKIKKKKMLMIQIIFMMKEILPFLIIQATKISNQSIKMNLGNPKCHC